MEQYKETEIGKIPANWKVVQVQSLICSNKGAMKIGPFGSQLKKDTFVSDGIKVYGQENIFAKDMNYGDRYISEDHFRTLKSCELHSGDFIISMMGTIGKCMIVPTGIAKGIMDSHLLRLQLNQSVIKADYLSQLFSSQFVLDQVKNLAVGGIMAGLSCKIVNEIKFIIPTLPEQQKIAEILSTVDDKLDVIEEKIKETQQLKQSLMQTLLTKGIWHTEFKDSPLGKIPVSWEVKPLENLVNDKRPIRYGIVQTGENLVVGIPCLRVADFTMRRFDTGKMIKTTSKISDSYKGTLLQENDIVFPLRGCIGDVRKIQKEMVGINLTRGVALISNSNKIHSDYLLWQILSANVRTEIQLQINGTTLKEVPIGGLKQVLIPVAQPEEQIKIATILSNMAEKLEVLQEKKSEYTQLKKGVMQQLLTGKIRVNHLIH